MPLSVDSIDERPIPRRRRERGQRSAIRHQSRRFEQQGQLAALVRTKKAFGDDLPGLLDRRRNESRVDREWPLELQSADSEARYTECENITAQCPARNRSARRSLRSSRGESFAAPAIPIARRRLDARPWR